MREWATRIGGRETGLELGGIEWGLGIRCVVERVLKREELSWELELGVVEWTLWDFDFGFDSEMAKTNECMVPSVLSLTSILVAGDTGTFTSRCPLRRRVFWRSCDGVDPAGEVPTFRMVIATARP